MKTARAFLVSFFCAESIFVGLWKMLQRKFLLGFIWFKIQKVQNLSASFLFCTIKKFLRRVGFVYMLATML